MTATEATAAGADVRKLRLHAVRWESDAERIARQLFARDDLIYDFAHAKAMGCWCRARLAELADWSGLGDLSSSLDRDCMTWWLGFEIGERVRQSCTQLIGEMIDLEPDEQDFWLNVSPPQVDDCWTAP